MIALKGYFPFVQEFFIVWLIFAGVLAVIYAYLLLTGKDIRYLAYILALESFCGAYAGCGLPHFTDSHAVGSESVTANTIGFQIETYDIGWQGYGAYPHEL